MTKRNPGHDRRKQDAYDTPPSVARFLLPHLPDGARIAEPCAGRGMLSDTLAACGFPVTFKADVEPRREDIRQHDALLLSPADVATSDIIVTNPPWSRPLMHRMIAVFRGLRPTWLLMEADWAFTSQAREHLHFCHTIVAVGRVSWLMNGTSGLDNCAWYLFGRDPVRTEFVGRFKG